MTSACSPPPPAAAPEQQQQQQPEEGQLPSSGSRSSCPADGLSAPASPGGGGGSSSRTITLYLIRHGEASHNVEERAAKKLALEQAIAEGLDADSREVCQRMEYARNEILTNPAFFDAALSDRGKSQALGARHVIEQLTAKEEEAQDDEGDDDEEEEDGMGEPLPYPGRVFVSPLQRTLQTADLIFPDHKEIHVREELRERLTGRPADNRAASTELARRDSFERFSFTNLVRKSAMNFIEFMGHDGKDCDNKEAAPESPKGTPSSGCGKNPKTLHRGSGSSFNADHEQEDEAKLRERTKKLLRLLSRTNEDSVAVVTHKGFLRSLERGVFGRPKSPEFKNCEVRAYRVTFIPGKCCVEDIERLR